jgi:hypothetical protein
MKNVRDKTEEREINTYVHINTKEVKGERYTNKKRTK